MVFSADQSHSDHERWVCIYPAYLNRLKSRAEGRRVPKSKAVENPNYEEIRDVLSAAGLLVGVENKLYPRENSKELLYRGRVRAQMKNDDNSPCVPHLGTRTSLLLYLCDNIPKLKSRHQQQQQSRQSGESVNAAGASNSATAGAAKKKSSKKH